MLHLSVLPYFNTTLIKNIRSWASFSSSLFQLYEEEKKFNRIVLSVLPYFNKIFSFSYRRTGIFQFFLISTRHYLNRVNSRYLSVLPYFNQSDRYHNEITEPFSSSLFQHGFAAFGEIFRDFQFFLIST